MTLIGICAYFTIEGGSNMPRRKRAVSRPFILAAGGTGGHLFAAEALAAELLSRGKEVHLLSDARAEAFAKQLPEIEIHHVRAGRFGGGPANTAHAFGELAVVRVLHGVGHGLVTCEVAEIGQR